MVSRCLSLTFHCLSVPFTVLQLVLQCPSGAIATAAGGAFSMDILPSDRDGRPLNAARDMQVHHGFENSVCHRFASLLALVAAAAFVGCMLLCLPAHLRLWSPLPRQFLAWSGLITQTGFPILMGGSLAWSERPAHPLTPTVLN